MNLRKKNIVWLTPGFAAHESDTSCIPTLQDLAHCFSGTPDYSLSIVAMHYPFDEKEYSWHGIPVFAIAGKNQKGWSRLKTYYRTWRQLKKLHQQKKIDVLHSFWIGDTSLVAQYFCSRYPIKHVATIMGQDALGNRYFRWSRFKSMHLVNLTPFAANHFRKASFMETAVIPFGLPATFASSLPTKTIDLLSVGSVIPLKNHEHFLKLVNSVKKVLPQVQALIVGEQHDKDYLKTLQRFISDHKLQDNVRLISKVSREESLHYMALSKIVIHVSHFESQGMVMLEALAMGCKVFSSGKGIILDDPQFSVFPESMEEQCRMIIATLGKKEIFPSLIPLSIEETYTQYSSIYQSR